ncbi:hypothetical protein XA68_12703 [Ophiocordyceps unilateralis]|uniref:Magnesium transport protein CorA n=1 Tax=Ophiocordyceps unilateralis TaxID=268505 RepID=A0A2A9PMP1_OPHUN|nr:hypothetical protein XA68_12703 [Ophiocordyceps unilateralis]
MEDQVQAAAASSSSTPGRLSGTAFPPGRMGSTASTIGHLSPGKKRSPLSDTDLRRSKSRRRGSLGIAAMFRTVDDCSELLLDDDSAPPGWQPGAEPGYDPELPDGGHASMPTLSARCNITVIDFSPDRMVQRHFDNEAFIAFLEKPQDKWATCRWINVNGLSWDVIQAVGSKKGLHKLALEDVMNLRNRTKADWYPSHAYIVLTLLKLVHLVDRSDHSSSSDDAQDTDPDPSLLRRLFRRGHRALRRRRDRTRSPTTPDTEPDGVRAAEKGAIDYGSLTTTTTTARSLPRSLHRFHASGSEARTSLMERESPLGPRNMAVAAEQVSIFLTGDNTAVSFFETSAADVERPIVTRLSTAGTILRASCDASLLVQALLDAIVDLALPLTTVYSDLLGDLELDVLTAPSIRQSRSLYLCIAEINKMLRFLQPVDGLVNALRDHRSPNRAGRQLGDPAAESVIVSSVTCTYLGDVLDHCIVICDALQQLKQSSEDLIGLIFNTISATQNESMRQLTTVTIIFLPLTFITGFFGQNFNNFPELHHGIWYFWACAVPTAVATVLILMHDMIYSWFVRLFRRKRILSLRRARAAPWPKRRRKLSTSRQ